MFTIDGISWPYPCKITRTAEVTASEISGLLLDKSYMNDVIGTYMSYEVTIAVPKDRGSQYATIYESLTDPVDGHAFILPYNSGTISITGRVVSVSDNYVRMPGGAIAWKGTTFTVIANHPSKSESLGTVITRGRTPFPTSASVTVGSTWQYTANGWVLVSAGSS